MPAEGPILAQTFPAHLLLPTERATVAQLTAAAQARAQDPSLLTAENLVFWTAEISNNRLDAYYTRMMPSTLKNFTEDAKAGVSFQDAHLTDGMHRTLGQSIGARYFGPGSQARPEGIAAVEADFYGVLGVDPAIDSYVNKVRMGLTKDVSVGFYGGWYRCSICDKDMRDYADYTNYCPHYPGQKIAVLDPKTQKKTDERVAVEAGIEDARLAEASGVYDGATPEASVLYIKARELADAGRLTPKEARWIEQRYRVRIPGADHIHAVGIDLRAGKAGTPPPAKEASMTLEEQLRALAADLGLPEGEEIIPHLRTRLEDTQGRVATAVAARDEQVRGALGAIGLTAEGDDLPGAIRSYGDALAAQKRQATYGAAWHKALIAEAAAEGVRALGSEKFTDQRRKALDSLTPEELIERRDTWAEMGDALLKGGRATREGDPPNNDALPDNRRDESIFPLGAHRIRRVG